MSESNQHDLRSHFGLLTTPFTREIPVSKRYHHAIFDEPLGAFRQCIDERMSAALVAAAGTGKTMLLRTLVDALPDSRYQVRYVKVTCLSKRDMCREIAVTVGCPPSGQYNTLVRRLQEHLETAFDQDGLRPVLILDEAHDMRTDVLAMLRVLTNFQMDSRLVVSVLLCGQKPLARMLRRAELEGVSRRLAHYATLRNLGRGEVRQYVAHRLRVAGARGDLFTDTAHDALFEIGGGNLRATDRLALKALQLACADNTDVVEQTLIAAARERLWP
jgi:general secretion pathway protein A